MFSLVPCQTVCISFVHLFCYFGVHFEFSQAAILGANNGLRGYRNERFTGKSAFVQSTDLRLNVTEVKTSLIPLYLGIYGGVDYGRVWLKNDDSDKWNNSFGGGIFVNMAKMFTGNISSTFFCCFIITLIK